MSDEHELDRKIAKAERDCAVLGISSRSRIQAADASRVKQLTHGNDKSAHLVDGDGPGRSKGASRRNRSESSKSEMSRRISPTRNIIGYAQRHNALPQWKETMAEFRNTGSKTSRSATARSSMPSSPSALSTASSSSTSSTLLSSLPLPSSAAESFKLDSYRLEVRRLKEENHRLRLYICTPTPTTNKHMVTDRNVKPGEEYESVQSWQIRVKPPSSVERFEQPKSMLKSKEKNFQYVIKRVRRSRHSESKPSRGFDRVNTEQMSLETAANNAEPPVFSSTMDTLRKREKDLCNIFLHYSLCDSSVRESASSMSSLGKHYWNESQLKRFLREFELLSLFGVRTAVDIFRQHASSEPSLESSKKKLRKQGSLYRMSYMQFMWYLCSLCNDLPSTAGATPEQRASLFLVGLDKGLLTKIAMSRSTIRIAQPNRSWISK